MLPGVGHAVHVEAPADFDEAVRTFLRMIAPPTSVKAD